MKILRLPQMSIGLPWLSPLARVLVTGGRAPRVEWLREVARGRELWAIDRGVDVCRDARLVPARLLGDADSADPDAWAWAASTHRVPTTRYPSAKDDTDTQLAFKLAGAAPFLLTGAMGGRFDHAFSTLFTLAGRQLPAVVADEREVFVPLHGGDRCALTFERRPAAISLLPMSTECAGVCARGVRWPLDEATLTQRYPYAVSNEPDGGSRCEVSLAVGVLAVYVSFES